MTNGYDGYDGYDEYGGGDPVGVLPEGHWGHDEEWLTFADGLMTLLRDDPQLTDSFNAWVAEQNMPPAQSKFAGRHGVLSDPTRIQETVAAIKRYSAEKRERDNL